jgi:hypothetical protein
MRKNTIVRPFFLAAEDEGEFSSALLQALPGIRFVDDNHWPTTEPVICESIAKCRSRYVFLWPSDLVEKLPSIPSGEGYEGPQSFR